MMKYFLLFGSDTWVLMPCILIVINSLHNRVALRISGRMPQWMWNGTWYYPSIGEALADAGLDTIGVYVYRRQNNVNQYIATQTIFNIVVE